MDFESYRKKITEAISDDQLSEIARKFERADIKFHRSQLPTGNRYRKTTFLLDYGLDRLPLNLVPGSSVESAADYYAWWMQEIGLPQAAKPLPSTEWRPRSILFITAAPTDTSRLRIDREFKAVQAILEKVPENMRPTLRLEPAVQISELAELLRTRKTDLIHFSGHGDAGKAIVETAAETATAVPLKAVARILDSLSTPPRYVITMACSTMAGGEALAAGNRQAICCSGSVDDEKAILFVSSLYRAIFDQTADAPNSFQACFDRAVLDASLSTAPGNFRHFA